MHITKGTLFLILLSATFLSHAQHRFGPQLGLVFSSKTGSATCDSIEVLLNAGSTILPPGIFYEYAIRKNLHARIELNSYRNSYSVIAYNAEEECLFCPLKLGHVVRYWTFDIPITLRARVPVTGSLSVGVIGGLDLQLNLRKRAPHEPPIHGHTGIADVFTALHKTTPSVITNYIYGFTLDYSRFTLLARYRFNAANSITRDINVWGKRHPFYASGTYVDLTVAYSFQVKRKDADPNLANRRLPP